MVYTYVDCGMRDKLRKSVISTAMARLRATTTELYHLYDRIISLSSSKASAVGGSLTLESR